MIDFYYFDPELATWQSRQITKLTKELDLPVPLWLDLSQATISEEQQVMQILNIAPTIAEDFTRERHPPKFETQEDFSLLILRGYADMDFTEQTRSAQVNLLFSKNVFISKVSCHNPQLKALLQPRLHTELNITVQDWVKQLILVVSGSYLGKLLNFEDELSVLEDAMLQKGNDEMMALMMRYRSVLRKVDRNLAYQKDIFSDAMFETEHPLSTYFTTTDLRDFYEKFERLHSMTEMYYDQLSDLVDGYMSTTSHQINERMKILTMVSTIFIPLTFVAGIYGMNFHNMPELAFANGYFITVLVMLLLGLGGLTWFKFKKWW